MKKTTIVAALLAVLLGSQLAAFAGYDPYGEGWKAGFDCMFSGTPQSCIESKCSKYKSPNVADPCGYEACVNGGIDSYNKRWGEELTGIKKLRNILCADKD